jgi:hypothetical protein
MIPKNPAAVDVSLTEDRLVLPLAQVSGNMAQWLTRCGIRTVVMQSTGVDWIAVHDVL